MILQDLKNKHKNIKMKIGQFRQLIREEIESVINNTNEPDFKFISKYSGDGKNTMELRLNHKGYEKIKHLFNSSGQPISNELKNIPAEGRLWNLSLRYDEKYDYYFIVGVSNDKDGPGYQMFGDATHYGTFKKYRGNKEAAEQILGMFIEKYLK
jgi:hypothetical protein